MLLDAYSNLRSFEILQMSSFYHFSWNDAENECTENNGHLTSVLSRYEQAYIFSSLPSETKCVWIGLHGQEQVYSVVLSGLFQN